MIILKKKKTVKTDHYALSINDINVTEIVVLKDIKMLFSSSFHIQCPLEILYVILRNFKNNL